MTLQYALAGVAESAHAFKPKPATSVAIKAGWERGYEPMVRLAGRPATQDAMRAYDSLARAMADDNAIVILNAGAKAAAAIAALRMIAVDYMGAQAQRRPLVDSWSAILAYVRGAMAHEGREQFRVLFLDNKNRLIVDHVMGQGTVNHAPVYPREVCRMALLVNAASVILVHNHPGGDPDPSQADIEMTRRVVEACDALKIRVHDHVVVGRDGVVSFRAKGLM